MFKLGLLVSGNLGFKLFQRLYEKYTVRFILTDKKSYDIISLAEQKNVPVFIGNPRKCKAKEFISNKPVDVIISINYLFLIESDIINHAKELTFNIHGSLLPKYRGRTPHVWAIINNEKYTGITAHRIDLGCDTGAIIDKIKIRIDDNDTGNDILLKYAEEYPKLVEKVLNSLKNGTISFYEQEENNATYFGKRTPDDGLINWDWQKERIFNWVRAQAHPYPGAFTFYRGQKIIIDKISFSDHGYNFDDENGTILVSFPKIVVKTPNGAIQLDKIRNLSDIGIDIKQFEKFSDHEDREL